MSYVQDNCIGLGATQIAIGLSAIVKIKADANQTGFALKVLSGGTLEIARPPIALSGSSATGWGTGYVLGATEVFSIGGPATFYLAATGATSIAALAIQFSAGASFGV